MPMTNAEYRAHVHKKLDEMLDALDRNDMPAAMMAILGLREETTKHVEKELHKCTCGGDCACKAAHSDSPQSPVESSVLNETAAADLHPRGLTLFNDAFKTINGERQDAYGNPEDSFSIIADFWQTYLKGRGMNVMVNALDVAHMMCLLKIARETNGKGKRDNVVDLLGYAAIAGVMSGYDK